MTIKPLPTRLWQEKSNIVFNILCQQTAVYSSGNDFINLGKVATVAQPGESSSSSTTSAISEHTVALP